jgi:phosphate transport system protein
MDRLFDEELRDLRRKLLHMAAHVEEAITLAVRSLKERKEGLAREVLSGESITNDADIAIDELSMRLLALRHPMASDLRFITSAMKIGSDLERIGDLAFNIAQRSLGLLLSPPLKPLLDIPEMSAVTQRMVRDAIKSFIEDDEALARDVCKRDDIVDQYNDQIFRELLTYMMADPGTISRAMDLILVSRHLERIADHATNIAEDVIYIVSGKTIKHHAEEKGTPGPNSEPRPG